MRKWTLGLGLLVIAAFILTACGGGNTSANEIMSDNNMGNTHNTDMGDINMSDDNMMNDDAMGDDDMGNDSMGDDNMGNDASGHDAMGNDNVGDDDMGDDAMDDDAMGMDTPAWFDYEFVDAATGQTFTINDFHGQVVMIETMAMWCSNCMKQQRNVLSFHQALGERDDFVAIGIDIDTNEDLAMLAGYVNQNGFNWLYSIATDEIAAEIARTFGPQYLNPPSTPIAIIDKDGNIHTLPFGIKSADDLMGYVETYLN